MKINKKKKGFTLVELIVVIAVIAVLAGVSIPAYFYITNQAKQGADEQAVTQMNTILQADEITNEKTIQEVYSVLEKNNLTANGYVPLASNTYFFWDSSLNRVLYVDEDYSVLYPEQYKGQKYKEGDFADHQWYSLSGTIDTSDVSESLKEIPSSNNFKSTKKYDTLANLTSETVDNAKSYIWANNKDSHPSWGDTFLENEEAATGNVNLTSKIAYYSYSSSDNKIKIETKPTFAFNDTHINPTGCKTEMTFDIDSSEDLISVAKLIRSNQSKFTSGLTDYAWYSRDIDTLTINLDLSTATSLDLMGTDLNFLSDGPKKSNNTTLMTFNLNINGNESQKTSIDGIYISDKNAVDGKDGEGNILPAEYGCSMFYKVSNLSVSNIAINGAMVGSSSKKKCSIFAAEVRSSVIYKNVDIKNSTIYCEKTSGFVTSLFNGTTGKIELNTVNINNCSLKASNYEKTGILVGSYYMNSWTTETDIKSMFSVSNSSIETTKGTDNILGCVVVNNIPQDNSNITLQTFNSTFNS